MKSLSQILEGLAPDALGRLDPLLLSLPIEGVTADSRQVQAGTVFVAIRGVSRDGHAFIEEARQRGAVCVVGESGAVDIQVPDARLALARLAANFHHHPSHDLVVIGVTGTSGKTTTTYMLESILKAGGLRPGVIGTVTIRYPGHEAAASQTTPDAVEIQRTLQEMRKAGCRAAILEVSSHALRQHRAAFVAFDAVVFTNLTPEHQDYHPDMEHYFESKAMLFRECLDYALAAGKTPVCAINEDDPYGQRLLQLAHPRAQCLPFGLRRLAAPLTLSLDGIAGEAHDIPFRTHLTGRFNASNLLGALAVARALQGKLGLTPAVITQGIAELEVVPGRLQRVPNSRGIHVFVDYAHKPDALEKVLATLKDALGLPPSGRLITVFGCGGDRDRKKRPVMGRMATQASDFVWITSDNPRTENPQAILEEILTGVQGNHYKVEPDRQRAIEGAIGMARPGDVVLIAGKGHEDYQIIADPNSPTGTRKIHFDDREVAETALKKASVP